MKKDPKSNIEQELTETINSYRDFADNLMVINSYISIVTLNKNGLNVPFKRNKVSGWT